MWILNTSFLNRLFNKIDGITLFLPQEIITLESQINFFSSIPSKTGVNLGGIKFQIFLSCIFRA